MPSKRRLVTSEICFGTEKAGLWDFSYNKCALAKKMFSPPISWLSINKIERFRTYGRPCKLIIIFFHRLSEEGSKLSEVEQKDVQVRLQELFRDKKNILEVGLRSIESTYEHILQETSTELTELEVSIKNKTELVQKLQDEILDMTVRKELLSKAMDQINENHQVKLRTYGGFRSVVFDSAPSFSRYWKQLIRRPHCAFCYYR